MRGGNSCDCENMHGMLPLVMVMVTEARVHDSGDTARVDCGDAGRGAAQLVRASFYKAGGRRIYS